MNIEELERLIANDENVHLELKKTTGELKDGMHTACAFLNGAGGAVCRMRAGAARPHRAGQRLGQAHGRVRLTL